MAKIKIVPSMAFDAICFFEHLAIDYTTYTWSVLPEQKAFMGKIENLTSGKLKDGFLGMSSLCGRISSYDENGGFENYTLDDLAEFFRNPENIRDGIISESIYASMKLSPEEWAEKYLNYINILKEIEFDKVWETDLLPVIREEIEKREEICKNLNMDGAFADIQRLKQCEPLEDVKIYIGVMSYPVAFKLHGNSFLDTVYGNMGVGIVCHELMHGCSNKELEKLYLEYVKSIKYLTEQHYKLINEMHSGNEEEFVAAAEYYLRMKHNGEDKKDLLKHARKNYGGCMPTSVFLFDLLSQESETPNGYADWLIDVFKNNKLPKKAIERNLDIICPKDPFENHNDKLFGSFRRVIDKFEEIQKGKSFDIAKKIENIVNQPFEEITEKSVFFAQIRQDLPNALIIKEICFDSIFISIAEYTDRATALCDGINAAGSNIGPNGEEVNGKWRALWNVNFSSVGKSPATVSSTFVKDNLRISFTAVCPEYVTRNMEYPSNVHELNHHIVASLKKMKEEGITMADIDREMNIPPFEEFAVKYSDEILAAQKKIEDIIMKL